MKELITVKITEVDGHYGNVIRERTKKFDNYKDMMFYVISFIGTHSDISVENILSDRIGLSYYDDNDDTVDVIISIMDEGSE